MYVYFVALSMFKCIHGMSPSYLSDCITMYNAIAVRDTRASTSSNLVTVPHAPLALFDNYFAYRGHVIWNALPELVRNCNSLYIRLKPAFHGACFRRAAFSRATFCSAC